MLPLGLAEQLGWWTPSAIALVSVVLLGIEEIGNEIEAPFSYDFNDLKLDDICATLLQDIKSVLSFSEEGILVNEPILEPEDDASDSEADTEGLRTANAA
ncbi:MAG: bestrophin family ion channel [Cyanobacteria bacterium J06627_28]